MRMKLERNIWRRSMPRAVRRVRRGILSISFLEVIKGTKSNACREEEDKNEIDVELSVSHFIYFTSIHYTNEK